MKKALVFKIPFKDFELIRYSIVNLNIKSFSDENIVLLFCCLQMNDTIQFLLDKFMTVKLS